LLKGDLTLFDEAGQVIATVQGLRLQRVSRQALQRSVQQRLDEWLYEVAWREQPVAPAERSSPAGRWLILADQDGTGQMLVAALADQRQEATLIYPGTAYEQQGEHWQVNPAA